jgi:hypothetical protein
MARPRLPLLRRDPGAGGGPATLGEAPADGDFVRLLEAASRPSAHRLGIDRAASPADPEAIATRGGRPPGADARPADARSADPVPAPSAPPAPPDTAWGRTATGSTQADAGARLPAPTAADAPDGSTGRPPSPLSAGHPAPPRPAGRSLRDRLVGVALAIAVLWTLAVALGRAMDAPDDAFGMLVVLGVVAFLVLRGRLRRRRD